MSRVTDMFVRGAEKYNDMQIDAFDEVFAHLIREIETKTLAELAAVDRWPSAGPGRPHAAEDGTHRQSVQTSSTAARKPRNA